MGSSKVQRTATVVPSLSVAVVRGSQTSIMDLKTPGSGECARNLWSNIAHLTKRDEVKCVIGSREDYEWSREQVRAHDLPARCGTVLFSPIFGRIEQDALLLDVRTIRDAQVDVIAQAVARAVAQ